MHGLGTGSDAQAPWMIGLTASCVAAVVLAVAARLGAGWPAGRRLRVAAGIACLAVVAGIAVFAIRGPLRPGWAVTAGTPASLLAPTPAAPVHPGPGGFSDHLVGVMARDPGGHVEVSLRDAVDPALTLALIPAASMQTLPVVTVARAGRTLCAVPARPGAFLYAVCGATRMTIALFSGPSGVTGTLSTSGPLG